MVQQPELQDLCIDFSVGMSADVEWKYRSHEIQTRMLYYWKEINSMKKQIVAVLVIIALIGLASPGLAEVVLKSKATEIKLTGRAHTQFNTSSVEGEIGSEFFIRRARITAEVKLNDFVHGKVQPDFGSGKLSLKDAYMKLNFNKNLVFRIGQFKRPFDLFELTSSTKILVVERAGKIRGASVTSLSSLTESLGFSDRDIGVEVHIQDANKKFGLTAAVTNSFGANKVPSKEDEAFGEKQFTGRLKVKPVEGQDLSLGISGSFRPYQVSSVPDTSKPDSVVTEEEYSPAVMFDVEYGNFKSGPHFQAGVVWGENWKKVSSPDEDVPTFMAGQIIGTYKVPIEDHKYVEAVEPIVRVCWADPDTDTEDDASILVTPGFQVFFTGRNKIAVNVDVFLPEHEDADTEYSIKIQSSVHF
jgi:hypothetical protein